MPRIVVDGLEYAPVGASTASFGVAITTRNRRAVLQRNLARWKELTPNGVPIIVVDDASNDPVDCDYRFDTNVGIATAKNKCLELLLAAGTEHLFLVDDDCYPLTENWWKPYIDSPEPHLFAVFTEPTNKSSRIEKLYEDSRHVAYHATRGYFLYYHRSVIDRVGGFDTRFFNAFEHVELSNRIHAAGLTSFPYQDVKDSGSLIFSEDSSAGAVASSIDESKRRMNEQAGARLLAQCAGRTDRVPFGSRDVVLSCLFTKQVDPQRGVRMKPNPDLADALLKSVTHEAIVLCDFPTERPQFVQVETNASPYIQRWISYRQWLVQHPEVRFVWCVDATDVVQLRDPFPMMWPGVLYCGWENTVVGCQWMRSNHAASAQWISENAYQPLLNAGVVGADRDTMLTFIGRLLGYWSESVIGRQVDKAGDMAFFNRAAYSMNFETGPHITTLFKGEETNSWSLWKHK